MLSLANAGITSSSLHFALIYLLAKEAQAASAKASDEGDASGQEATSYTRASHASDAREDNASPQDLQEAQAAQSEVRLTPEQAREQLRALIEDELAHGRVARGLSDAQFEDVQQAASPASLIDTAVAKAPVSGGVVANSQPLDLSSLTSLGGGLLLMAAGMGGGGGGSAVANVVLASLGIVADGYIKGATVTLLDAKGNVLATTTTDANGRYQFDGALAQKAYKIVATGGVDVSTGLNFDVKLSAPVGAGVVNPLTTLVQSFMEANPGASVASASQAIKKVLGITGTEDLLQTDPIAQALTSTGLAQTSAIALQAKAAQIANLLVTGAAAVVVSKGGTTDAAVNAILDSLTQQIVKSASAATPTVLDLASAPIVSGLLGLSGSVVELIAAGNNVSAGSLQGIYEFQKAVQDDLTSALLTGTLSSQAVQALDSLLSVVSSGQKVVGIELKPADDSGVSQSDGYTRIANPGVRVDLASVAAVVKVGFSVELKLEGVTLANAPVSQADIDRGYLDFSIPNFTQDGSKTVAVVVLDPVTQKGVASGFVAITLDTHVQALQVGLVQDTGKAGDNITQNGSVQVTGLERDAVWQYSLDGGKTWSNQQTAQTISLAGQEGPIQLEVRQIDKAGNTSDVSNLSLVLDSKALSPSVSLQNDTGVVGDNITRDPSLKIANIEQGADRKSVV